MGVAAMFYVGLKTQKPHRPYGPTMFICVRQSPFRGISVIRFNTRNARLAVRRYVKGNLSAALVCFDDGANEPADACNKQYARTLCRMFMIPGTGPGGFKVDYGR
jgi:hypothetical protein